MQFRRSPTTIREHRGTQLRTTPSFSGMWPLKGTSASQPSFGLVARVRSDLSLSLSATVKVSCSPSSVGLGADCRLGGKIALLSVWRLAKTYSVSVWSGLPSSPRLLRPFPTGCFTALFLRWPEKQDWTTGCECVWGCASAVEKLPPPWIGIWFRWAEWYDRTGRPSPSSSLLAREMSLSQIVFPSPTEDRWLERAIAIGLGKLAVIEAFSCEGLALLGEINVRACRSDACVPVWNVHNCRGSKTEPKNAQFDDLKARDWFGWNGIRMRFSYIGRKVNRCFAQNLHQNRMPEINRCICWEAKFFPHIHTHNGGKGKRGSLINGGKCNHIARSGENKAIKQRAASRMDGQYFNPVLGELYKNTPAHK